MSRIVKLNVGGVQYTTSVSTIAQYPDSMLALMIGKETERQKIESGNELFIDRNGHAFKYVLEFLRNGDRLVLPRDKETQREVALEAEFYQLDGLSRLIGENCDDENQIVKLNVGGTRYEMWMMDLAKYPDSTLGRMIQQPRESKWIEDDEEIFISRDGTLFDYIRRYLCAGEISILPDDDLAFLRELLLEAQFYELDGLKAIIEQKMDALTRNGWKVGDVVTLSDARTNSPDLLHDLTRNGVHVLGHPVGKITQFKNDGEAVVRFTCTTWVPPSVESVKDVSATYIFSLNAV